MNPSFDYDIITESLCKALKRPARIVVEGFQCYKVFCGTKYNILMIWDVDHWYYKCGSHELPVEKGKYGKTLLKLLEMLDK